MSGLGDAASVLQRREPALLSVSKKLIYFLALLSSVVKCIFGQGRIVVVKALN